MSAMTDLLEGLLGREGKNLEMFEWLFIVGSSERLCCEAGSGPFGTFGETFFCEELFAGAICFPPQS